MSRASAGSTSSICSGSSHFLMAHPRTGAGHCSIRASVSWADQEKDGKAGHHRDEAEEAQLPIVQLERLAEHVAPHLRRHERQDALEDERERDPGGEDLEHRAYLPRPGLLKYLK